MSDSTPANPSVQGTSAVDVLSEGNADDVVTETGEETSEEGEGTTEGETTDEGETTEEEDLETKEPGTEDEETLDEDETLEESSRPSWKLIKEKYPELAKDKDFREIYYRDKAFTEVFPTVADAKEANAKAEALDLVDSHLLDGNLEEIFTNVGNDTLEVIADKVLPALFKTNVNLFRRATQPLIIDLMNNVLAKAENAKDNNLKISARNVWRALTGNPEIPNRARTIVPDPSVEEERNKLRNERNNLFQGQQNNFIKAVDRSTVTRLVKLAEEGVDPNRELTDFARQAVVDKTVADLDRILRKDIGLRNKLISLHKLAARSSFPDEYKSRMISASLERARKLIPSIRSKHKMAALGKQPSKGTGKVKVETETRKVNSPGGSSRSSSNIDMRKTSAIDFLNDKVTFKK